MILLVFIALLICLLFLAPPVRGGVGSAPGETLCEVYSQSRGCSFPHPRPVWVFGARTPEHAPGADLLGPWKHVALGLTSGGGKPFQCSLASSEGLASAPSERSSVIFL